jgi:hypothetical protein
MYDTQRHVTYLDERNKFMLLRERFRPQIKHNVKSNIILNITSVICTGDESILSFKNALPKFYNVFRNSKYVTS